MVPLCVIDGDWVNVTVKTSIHSMECIFSSAYVLLDKAYIIFDGDPQQEIIVHIRSKNAEPIETIIQEFHNQLINYAVYTKQHDRSKEIKKILLQRALLTNLAEPIQTLQEEVVLDQRIEDPENIAKAYGN